MLGDLDVTASLAVKDLEVAKRFYEETLGLSKINENEGGVLYKSGSTRLLVYPSQYAGSNKATAAGWKTNDVEKVVDALRAKGVVFEHYNDLPGLTLDGDLHTAGEMKVAWFKDPSGNILCVDNMM